MQQLLAKKNAADQMLGLALSKQSPSFLQVADPLQAPPIPVPSSGTASIQTSTVHKVLPSGTSPLMFQFISTLSRFAPLPKYLCHSSSCVLE
jgi:hypothetical protein